MRALGLNVPPIQGLVTLATGEVALESSGMFVDHGKDDVTRRPGLSQRCRRGGSYERSKSISRGAVGWRWSSRGVGNGHAKKTVVNNQENRATVVLGYTLLIYFEPRLSWNRIKFHFRHGIFTFDESEQISNPSRNFSGSPWNVYACKCSMCPLQ